MNTAFLLMAQYNAQAVIPVASVVKDYFPHLTTDNFLRKVAVGDIKIPLVRIEPGSQKGARGVHLTDLAQYLDDRRAAAVKEARQLAGASA
jgi:Pyocin activator protein PrtN